MKTKKFLYQQAEQDRQTILSESDERFLQETKAKIEANSPAPAARRFPRLKYLAAGGAGILASVAVLVCVLVFFPRAQGGAPHYYEDNFVRSSSTVREMDDDMKEFTFNISDTLNTIRVEKTTDSVSGDVIMYRADITSIDATVDMTIIAVCNENYNYDGWTITDNYSFEKLPLYDIRYLAEEKQDPNFGFDTYSAQAEIQRNSEYIYINYTEALSGQPRFFDLIQSLIQ